MAQTDPAHTPEASTPEHAADPTSDTAPSTVPASPAAEEFDLSSPELYLNRELTWLEFNKRVLHEADDARNPLLERVKFLAIVGSNMDEFFMKRIGGLKQQVAAGITDQTVDGRTPMQQIEECIAVARGIMADQLNILDSLCTELNEAGIRILRLTELSEEDREKLREHFVNNIFPILTPLAMDPGHPFPFISNLTLNLLVTMRFPGDDEGVAPLMARLKVPVSGKTSNRLIRLGWRDDHSFVLLEDLIESNLDLLFPGMEIGSCDLFRITRNANVERDEETADDLLAMIETEVRERHFAPIVRLEVHKGMDPTRRGMLAAELRLNEERDVIEHDGMIALRDLFDLAFLDIPELHDAPHHPIDHAGFGNDSRNIFHLIRNNGPFLLQHPYENFSTSVERFLRMASRDPKVLAIKMTLYRTSAEGKIIDSLVQAARNGKQVAVLVELKARFDEAANIRWARRLENAGIHVTYGLVGLKTHTKIVLVVRKDFNGIQRYAHVGTGNYHAGTARLYTDLGILTNDADIGQDLSELFNYLTGYSPPPSYRKVLAAPYTLKKALIGKIEREITHHQEHGNGHCQLKMNALEDADVTRALYRACQAGVKVELIVRDTCRFRPGIPGLSETGSVISIVGRFLEHSRIFYFANNGEPEYYIGSADLMKRNLESRVEVVAPVEDPTLQQELRMILDAQLGDRRGAWDMQSDGSYVQRMPAEGESTRSAQDMLVEAAQKRSKAAKKHQGARLRNRLARYFQRRAESTQSS
ncbi:MAG: polyphosphate kinase 1 [Gammaproteobacteria bacterium]